LILNWNPEHGGDQNIPCGTVRVTPGWHINAIDLVFAVCQPARREIAAKTLGRLISNQLLRESDIIYVVLSQLKRIGILSFSNAIKPLMLLGGRNAMIEREKFARVLYLFYNEVKPICSSFNVEAYLKVFPRNGRRRGTGVVSRPMADQFMKAVSDQRSQTISKQLPHFQTPEWRLENPESMLTSVKVLRSQAIINLLRAFGRRQTADNQIR
jgi:hypothetical protein